MDNQKRQGSKHGETFPGKPSNHSDANSWKNGNPPGDSSDTREEEAVSGNGRKEKKDVVMSFEELEKEVDRLKKDWEAFLGSLGMFDVGKEKREDSKGAVQVFLTALGALERVLRVFEDQREKLKDEERKKLDLFRGDTEYLFLLKKNKEGRCVVGEKMKEVLEEAKKVLGGEKNRLIIEEIDAVLKDPNVLLVL
jgi:hypothetical protein